MLWLSVAAGHVIVARISPWMAVETVTGFEPANDAASARTWRSIHCATQAMVALTGLEPAPDGLTAAAPPGLGDTAMVGRVELEPASSP